jgi:RNA polymerase sigma-70 factor (ECF subfamily)
MLEDPPDENLMISVANGNQAAFRLLVDRHLGRAHGIALRMMQSPMDAEETVQDAFTKIWIHAPGFDPERAQFKTWFTRIVTNACLDRLRVKQPSASNINDMQEILPDGLVAQDVEFVKKKQNEALKIAVQSLPDRQRMAVVLCCFEEMTNPQAAFSMGIHIKALEGLLVRARKQLRVILGEQHE